MITHPQLVKSLAKSGAEIVDDIQPCEAHLAHMALGVAGEAGEIVDIIKKHIIYHKCLDIDKVVEEMGDLLFYVQGICQELGVDINEVLRRNIDKLTKRYGSEYSDEAAIKRADAVKTQNAGADALSYDTEMTAKRAEELMKRATMLNKFEQRFARTAPEDLYYK